MCWDCLKALKGTRIEFVRFGKPPEGGYSYNAREQSGESGVSVYLVVRGKMVAAGLPYYFMDRPCFRGTAIMVGTGGDDEPTVDWSTVEGLRRVRKPIEFWRSQIDERPFETEDGD